MLLRLALQGLESLARTQMTFSYNAEDESLREAYATVLDSPADLSCFLGHCLVALLYQPVAAPKPRMTQDPIAALRSMQGRPNPSGAEVLAALQQVPAEEPPQGPAIAPGLSLTEMQQQEAKGRPTLDVLSVRKMGILNWTVRVGLAPQDCVPLYLAASCDPSDQVNRRGEELSKRRCGLDTQKPVVDLEEPGLVARLFEMLLGTAACRAALSGPRDLSELFAAAPTSGDSDRTPVGPVLASKLLSTLSRSLRAADSFPLSLMAVDRYLLGGSASARTQPSAMEFAVWVFRHGRAEVFTPGVLSSIASALLSQLGAGRVLQAPRSTDPAEALHLPFEVANAVAEEAARGHHSAAAANLRGFCYEALGLLADKSPESFAASGEAVQALPRVLFTALPCESPAVRGQLMECLRTLAACLADEEPERPTSGNAQQDDMAMEVESPRKRRRVPSNDLADKMESLLVSAFGRCLPSQQDGALLP